MTITLTKYTAKWCVPCKIMEPTIKKFLKEHPDVVYEAIDVELRKNQERCDADHVLSIPTMIFRVDGKRVWRVNRAVTERALIGAYERAVKKGAS